MVGIYSSGMNMICLFPIARWLNRGDYLFSMIPAAGKNSWLTLANT
jgi:hypothetical protein